MTASERTSPAPLQPPSARRRTLLASLLAGSALLMAGGFVLLVVTFPGSRGSLGDPGVSGGLVLGVSFPVVGWIVATKRPENAMGWSGVWSWEPGLTLPLTATMLIWMRSR